MASDNGRLNIRVEIQNNFIDTMEVDHKSDEEDGEITDTTNNIVKGFVSGNDIFLHSEKEKLEERARRFHLKPEEIKNFTDNDLKLLYKSLGITSQNSGDVRFEAIHLRGIKNLNPAEILDYFKNYAPDKVEWVDEESCNVVWLDKISAARALHFISKPINGMPIRCPDPFEYVEEKNQSILISKNREIQLDNDNHKFSYENGIDISDILINIPPGYWRSAKTSSEDLLMRFSFKTDKKPYKIQLLVRYYSSLIKSQKIEEKQIKTDGIFGRNKHLQNNEKNPWGVLAKNWDEDKNYREREPNYVEEKVQIKNPNILGRLGTKRKDSDIDESKTKKVPRMRMYADEEEEKIKRKKLLTTIKSQLEKLDESKCDLRNILSSERKTKTDEKPDVLDLGTTLKNRKKKMIFALNVPPKKNIHSRLSKRLSTEREQNHSWLTNEEDNDEDFGSEKPKSKVAVVIKTQKRPTVASSINSVWSRVNCKIDTSSKSNSSISSSSASSISSTSNNDEENFVGCYMDRPGFNKINMRKRSDKAPLKIEINNDHFKQ